MYDLIEQNIQEVQALLEIGFTECEGGNEVENRLESILIALNEQLSILGGKL